MLATATIQQHLTQIGKILRFAHRRGLIDAIPAMDTPTLAETLTAIAYRLGMYWANNAVDDPAMLAFIFC